MFLPALPATYRLYRGPDRVVSFVYRLTIGCLPALPDSALFYRGYTASVPGMYRGCAGLYRTCTGLVYRGLPGTIFRHQKFPVEPGRGKIISGCAGLSLALPCFYRVQCYYSFTSYSTQMLIRNLYFAGLHTQGMPGYLCSDGQRYHKT